MFSGKLKTYIVLCEQYQSSLIRDPSYTEYLDKIGQLFFNVKPNERRPRQQNGFLGRYLLSIVVHICLVLFNYVQEQTGAKFRPRKSIF